MAKLISIRNTGGMKMRAVFMGTPTREEIYAAQCNNGFAANGFPTKIEFEPIENPAHVVQGELSVVNFQLQER